MRARSALLGFCALLIAVGALCAPASAGDAGMVKTSKGSASIERAGQGVTASPGTRVQEGDVVVTGTDGSVGITFVDNTLLSVGPDSRLTIDRFTFDPVTEKGTFEASLQRGTLAGVSGKVAKQSPDAMKVRTPSSILGIRGTEFVVSANDD